MGGLIIGALSFRNEYDGHTIDPAMEQVKRLTGRRLKVLAGDRGYKGQKMSGTTKVVIPDTPKTNDSYYKRRKKHDLFCKTRRHRARYRAPQVRPPSRQELLQRSLRGRG